MTNDHQIKDRIQGSKDALELLSLYTSDSVPYQIVFWLPMTDEEARVFAESPIPFGKHHGRLVGWVLDSDPDYLDWLVRATEEDTFKQDLRRFLARKDVQDQLP